jgi:hypothetical protein
VTEEKAVVCECCQLHSILEQARPRGETCFCKAFGSRVVSCYSVIYLVKIQIILSCDLVELVRDGKLQISPYIRVELCQFGFNGFEGYGLVCKSQK